VVQNGANLFLLFRIGRRLCALPIDAVVEMLRPLPLQVLPDAPDVVIGLAVIRGEPVPVLDLHEERPAHRTPESRLIVLHVANRRVALGADSVIGLRPLDHQRLGPLPALLSENAATVEAIGTLDGELLAVLSAARLVPEHVLAISDAHRVAS